jgi:hypothetical protein
MGNAKKTAQVDMRWMDKNYVYQECLKYLEEIGRTDLTWDIGYVLTGYTKKQLVKLSVNGLKPLIEQAERLSTYRPQS